MELGELVYYLAYKVLKDFNKNIAYRAIAFFYLALDLMKLNWTEIL